MLALIVLLWVHVYCPSPVCSARASDLKTFLIQDTSEDSSNSREDSANSCESGNTRQGRVNSMLSGDLSARRDHVYV